MVRLGLSGCRLALDVGAGKGTAALLVLAGTHPAGVVVGIDPSPQMLQIAQAEGLRCVAVARAPGLPHPDGVFDRVLANFVISHFTSYQLALSDMVRVLRPGGRLGATAWAAGQDDPRQLWQQTAESFADKDVLRIAMEQALPWEAWFGEAAHVTEALRGAGLVRLDLHTRRYETVMSRAEFLAWRESSMQGRFLRQELGPSGWERFQRAVAENFRERFGHTVCFSQEVHLAVAAKP